MERDIGFEPTTFSLGRSGASVGGGSKGLQAGDNFEIRSERESPVSPPSAAVSSAFVSGLCLENQSPRPGADQSRGTPDRLLFVKQVAERLGVATATVYGLCADGRLAHVRILNVIRIAPSDLSAFIDSCRSPASMRQRS
jgi:excisionase family DNA binding protein